MEIQTPAKINTQLYILKKRKDGYHDLYTHLVPISLFDRIRLNPNSGKGITLTLDGHPCGPKSENLILKAAWAFEEQTGVEIDMHFHLCKHIPAGAGLGGGSGNAAGVLQALNHYYRFPLKTSELKKIGATLGSDIPFFIDPRPCEAQGRGEQLALLLQYPSFFLVIIKPSFAISTAEAYRHCHTAPMPTSVEPVKTFNQLATSLHNQFETTLLSAFPELTTLKEKLLECGAVAALVSGSGSAVFGLFSHETAQRQAYQQLLNEQLGDVFCCHSIENHQYFSF